MDNFSIIHHRGEPQEATTLKGQKIFRQDHLFVVEWGQFVPCAPYDDHFVYENPDTDEGTSAYMCTCGSAAVIANPEEGGRMFVCLFHATHGSHTTSHVNLKDFPGVAGETIKVEGSKGWL